MRRASSIGLAALHAATFTGFGVFLPFFPVWLASRGLDPSAIAALLTIPILVRVALAAPLVAVADTGFGARGLLVACHLALAAACAALGIAEGVLLIGLLVTLVAAAQTPLIPTNDLVTMDAARADPSIAYGRVRLWGSIAFIVANLAMGWLLARAGADAVIVALAILPVLGVLITLAVVPAGRRAAEPAREGPRVRWPAALWVALAAAACIQATHQSLYAFASIHWRALGFADPVIGALWATGVVAEILLFAVLGAWRGRRAAAALLAAGGAAGILRFSLLAIDPGLALTFAAQALHGLTFGATHLGLIAAIASLAPAEARGRAQGVAAALLAAVGAAATLASGLLYERVGGGLFWAMVPPAALGLVLALLAARAPADDAA